MKKDKGLTLIELIAFIVVVGIVLAACVSAFTTVLKYNAKPGNALAAIQLADARMNIIVQQRRINGFVNIYDPCNTGPGGATLAACAGLNAYATNGGYVISSSIPAAINGVRTATITVTGTGNATNVVRFVQ